MTTKEAFEKLTSGRSWYKKTGINASTARSLKYYFKNGGLSEYRMSELLIASGYKVQPAAWSAPDHISESEK